MNASTTTLPLYCPGEAWPEGVRWISKSGEGRGSGAADPITDRYRAETTNERSKKSISLTVVNNRSPILPFRRRRLLQQLFDRVAHILLLVVEERIASDVLISDHSRAVDKHHAGHIERRHHRVVQIGQDFRVRAPAN